MITVNWATGGDLWITTNVGLFHSSDFAASFRQIPGFTSASGVALGAPKSTGGYPTVFASAVYNGVTGYFRSDDAGANCRFILLVYQNTVADFLPGVQINDDDHGFGMIDTNPISGDPRIYGRVYIGTNGRGIFYGDIDGAQPSERVSSSSAPPTRTPVATTRTTANAPASTRTTTSAPASTRPTTNAPASTNAAGPWAQCGGQNWTGPTSCGPGWTCRRTNEFYSQCLRQHKRHKRHSFS